MTVIRDPSRKASQTGRFCFLCGFITGDECDGGREERQAAAFSKNREGAVVASRSNPLDGFRVDPSTISYVGANIQRAECILATPDGSIWITDPRGGVLRIGADGSRKPILPKTREEAAAASETADWRARYEAGSAGTPGRKSLPNGIAFAPNGDIYIANVGLGRLERLTQAGELDVLLDSIEGKEIGQLNFVLADRKGRLWLTIPSSEADPSRCLRPDYSGGRIALYENGKARIVADGIRFTNEVRLDAKEEWLYISETAGPYVSRMRVKPNGDLTDYEIFGPRDHGALIDGISFDSYGNLWGTHVFTDQIFIITPEGELRILLDDAPSHSKSFMEAFYKGAMTRELMMSCGGKIAPWMTSVTFGGPDLMTVYVGSIFGTSIATFRSPVAGLPLPHWT